jgi:hypothetical protein
VPRANVAGLKVLPAEQIKVAERNLIKEAGLASDRL